MPRPPVKGVTSSPEFAIVVLRRVVMSVLTVLSTIPKKDLSAQTGAAVSDLSPIATVMVRTSPIARLDHARLVDWIALAPEYKTITWVPSAGAMFMKPTARCAVVATSVFCEVRAVHPVMPCGVKSCSSPKENRPVASGLSLASKLELVMETSAAFAPESANAEVARETSKLLVS